MLEQSDQDAMSPSVPAPAGADGLGLGLGIARALVRAHGGTLEARNRATTGACLAITLPLAQAVPDEGETASYRMAASLPASVEPLVYAG
jgi:hypothetical protein